MNVFILSTGRCGSSTFIEACKHIENFTSSHESKFGVIGPKKMDYPVNHVEADNRITWVLGRLEKAYGDNAFYVHLKRDKDKVVSSLLKRYGTGIINAYARHIVTAYHNNDPVEICQDYYETVNSNIEAFLANKTNKMDFNLENAQSDFRLFWSKIGAVGDINKALDEWIVKYNSSDEFKINIMKKLLISPRGRKLESLAKKYGLL